MLQMKKRKLESIHQIHNAYFNDCEIVINSETRNRASLVCSKDYHQWCWSIESGEGIYIHSVKSERLNILEVVWVYHPPQQLCDKGSVSTWYLGRYYDSRAQGFWSPFLFFLQPMRWMVLLCLRFFKLHGFTAPAKVWQQCHHGL